MGDYSILLIAIWVCVCGHILGGVGEIWLLFLCVKITDKYRTGHAYYGINIKMNLVIIKNRELLTLILLDNDFNRVVHHQYIP